MGSGYPRPSRFGLAHAWEGASPRRLRDGQRSGSRWRRACARPIQASIALTIRPPAEPAPRHRLRPYRGIRRCPDGPQLGPAVERVRRDRPGRPARSPPMRLRQGQIDPFCAPQSTHAEVPEIVRSCAVLPPRPTGSFWRRWFGPVGNRAQQAEGIARGSSSWKAPSGRRYSRPGGESARLQAPVVRSSASGTACRRAPRSSSGRSSGGQKREDHEHDVE